jgi:predicted ester cyclase
MSLEENKAIVQRFFDECHNQKNLDAMSEITASTLVRHGPEGDTTSDLEKRRKGLSEMFDASPDLHDEILNIIAEGDKVGVLLTRNQTFLNQFRGLPPTGEKVSLWAYELFRIANGKIVEIWSIFDSVALQKFLGTYGK